MNKYLIALNGCDDTTYCELKLNDKELEFLIKISKEINKHSSYGCQPTIRIYKDYEILDDEEDIFYEYGKDILEDDIYDIPGFEGTLEELDNLSIRGKNE